MYKQYCRDLLDGVWELWRDIFKAERAQKAQDAAKLKMEQEMHRFKQAEHDRAFNTAKQIAEQMYKKYCNGLFDEIMGSWKEETMKTKKEKLAKKQQGEEEAKQKAQQEKDLREAEVLAQKMYKGLRQDDVKYCFDVWLSEHKAESTKRRDEEAKKKHEAELAALRRMEQETGERAALQIAQKMHTKIVDDNKRFILDSWHRIAKKQRADKKEEAAKREHQDELDRIRREELEKKDKAAGTLAEQMFRKYWNDNMNLIVELWKRQAITAKDTRLRKKHEEELARLKRSQEETGVKAAVEISRRMLKAYCDSLQKLTLSSWRVWAHQSRATRKEEEAKRNYEQEMAKIKRLEMEKANKAATIAGLNMYRKVLYDNTALILTTWKDHTKNELLARKLEKDMRDHKNDLDNVKKEQRLKNDRVRQLVASNMFAKDKKEVLSDAFAKWVISWRQTVLEQKQHEERIQHKDQMEKMRRAEAEKKEKMKSLMVSQFNATGNRALLHICVNNWRLVWEATKVERQQALAVDQLTGKLRQLDKKTNDMVNRTKDKLSQAFYGRAKSELLALVMSAWRADAKEEVLLRRKAELASSYEKDLKLMQKKQRDFEAMATEKMAKSALSQLTGATLSVCLLQWRNFVKESKQERREAEMRQQLEEELKKQKREAEKLNDSKSRQIAMNMVSFERNSTMSVCIVAWRQQTQISKKEAEEAAAKQQLQQDLNKTKSKAEKVMLATRDRMAVQLLGQQNTHLQSAIFGLWRTIAKEEKMATQQAEKERLNKVELARLDGQRREAAKEKAYRTAARFFQNHNGSLLAETFIQFRKCVEISLEERKTEEARRLHEEEVRRMERLHSDRRAKFIATSVQGKERMLLFGNVKQCLLAWSQLVLQSQIEVARNEQEDKHKEEMNEVKSLLVNHSKKNGVYAALSHEAANHQYLLQRLLGVWKEYRAEQAVQRIYEERISQMMVQFEDDTAELMHAQGLKIYNLRLALAEMKGRCERKLMFQYCLQKWDECKYQRQLENELGQVNERHEDELAELVHAQGVAKHRMVLKSQGRFLTGVKRQEMQRHFLAWSHVKRLTSSAAAELLAVAKAKQSLEKDNEVRNLKALRLKDHVVQHVGKTILFVRLKDIWLAWLHQVLLHRLEVQQEKQDRLHRKEIQVIRKEAEEAQQSLGDRMHQELEQVGRESYLRDMLLAWQTVVKSMRSHRSYHGTMDQIRQEAEQDIKVKEKKNLEKLSVFAVQSAELLVRRRKKEPLLVIFMNWRLVQDREKYQEYSITIKQQIADTHDKHVETLRVIEEKKQASYWKLATLSFIVREKVILRLYILHVWREACMWTKKMHKHLLRKQGDQVAAHSKEVSLLTTSMLVHTRELSLLTKVMCQWRQQVERHFNQQALELKDEENSQRVKTSVFEERLAGSKRAQVLIKWVLQLDLQTQSKWITAWAGEVKYAKVERSLEVEKESHGRSVVKAEETMAKHQDALVPYWLRLKRQMTLMRYFPAFCFIPYVNQTEAHLQKTIEKLDKKRERQIEDMYKLRRKSVAAAGEVLNFFRAQREMQMTMALVLVVWLEYAAERMATRRWGEQREVKMRLENELKVLQDKTWHLKVDTKKGKDLTDTCRHMAEWTGQLLMEISVLHAWGCWRLWHVREAHAKVLTKANNHAEARVMQEKLRAQLKKQKDEVVMSNVMVAASDISLAKFSFRVWWNLVRDDKEHRSKTTARQEHRREMFDLKQDMIAKLRASNTRENQLKDLQQVLKCLVAWSADVKAEHMAADLLGQEEQKRQGLEEQIQKAQQDLTVETAARKGAEAEARTASELLHHNGIQFPPNPKDPPEVRERAMLPVERVAAALQRVYRRRLTAALVAMLTTAPRKLAWYERTEKAPSPIEDKSRSRAKPKPLALPFAPAPSGVASTLDFLARTRQMVEGQSASPKKSPERLPGFGSLE
ncbi:unnamed protein product, partial [Effrenium voratum]